MTIYGIASAALVLMGSVFVFISAIGLIKMPDIYMRLSATTKAATLGVGSVLLGTAFFFLDLGVAARVVVIATFLFMTAPVAAHMIGRAAYFHGVPLWPYSVVNELEDKHDHGAALSKDANTAKTTTCG